MAICLKCNFTTLLCVFHWALNSQGINFHTEIRRGFFLSMGLKAGSDDSNFGVNYYSNPKKLVMRTNISIG